MDYVDIAILASVQKDAKGRQADIADRIGVSLSTVNDRLRRLEREGVITEFVARISAGELGFSVCAFVQVLIGQPEHESAFVDRMAQLDQVQECHCITGDFSYLLKVRAQTPENLERFLREEIKSSPGVRRTNTVIALSTSKESIALPLDLLVPENGEAV